MPKLLPPERFSSATVSSEYSCFTKGKKIKIFSPKLGKTDKRLHNFRDIAILHYFFYNAAKTIESLKSGNDVTRGNRFDRPGDERNA